MKLVIYCSTLLSESHKEWNVECDVSPDITQSHSIRNRFKNQIIEFMELLTYGKIAKKTCQPNTRV